MTAIAGLWRFDGRQDAADGCARMLTVQELYGPDAGAQWSSGDVALGRRLMRLLPEDAFDCQPFVGGGGRFVLVADVRVDNREELTEALQISTSNARLLCDAALLLSAFERWEESCFDRLVGDYAFALWDGVQQRLLLARDPLGQRPLHYHRGNGFCAFASMPKGLHAMTEVSCELDEDRVAEWLVMLPETGPRTLFRGIERVEPAHVVTVTRAGIASRRHWQPSRRTIVLSGRQEYAEALRNLLDQAVQCRLRGANDIGAQLSGGLDSSGVASTAARLLAPSGRRVIAFTAVPREGYDGQSRPDRINDELPYAAATAAMYPNIEHVLIRNPNRSPLDDLDRNFLLFDRPIPNICNLSWSNAIYDVARERKLTVMLTGLLGNIGMSYQGMTLLPELFASGRWIQWWCSAQALAARQGMSWPLIMAKTLGPWFPAAAWVWLFKFRFGQDLRMAVGRYSAIHPRRLAELNFPARARACGLDLAQRPPRDGFALRLWALGRVDRGNYNKGTLAGWHIDQRDPTADVRLLQFCLSVPVEQYVYDGVPRALARRALAERVPKLVLEARRGLQAADWHEQLTPVRDRVAAKLDWLETFPSVVRALDLPRLRRLIEDWPAGGWERDEVIMSYRLALLRAISTGDFMGRVVVGNKATVASITDR